jgi:hypothetical protein
MKMRDIPAHIYAVTQHVGFYPQDDTQLYQQSGKYYTFQQVLFFHIPRKHIGLIAEVMAIWISSLGSSKVMQCDNGKEFTGVLLTVRAPYQNRLRV